ncbi:CU044_2847 family protein [Streptomyces sp. NPDC085866]|uniref:CU044_2847 family protein n=1 Tax=Streptomyces sp. NPDC085866 TaxID=3365736 RepID=UPI0037CF4A51
MERRIQEVELADGQKVLARVSVLSPEDIPGLSDEFEFEDVGALDHMAARIDQLNELVGAVGGAVLDAARATRPDEVSATFGVELAVKPGKAVALLADGEAKAALAITLTWRGAAGAPESDAAAATSAAQAATGTALPDTGDLSSAPASA